VTNAAPKDGIKTKMAQSAGSTCQSGESIKMKDYTPIIHTEACGKVAAWYPTDKMTLGAPIKASLFILPDGTSLKSPIIRVNCQHCGRKVRPTELKYAYEAVKQDRKAKEKQ